MNQSPTDARRAQPEPYAAPQTEPKNPVRALQTFGLIATGSEISIALQAHGLLTTAGIQSRVVSMPSWELFERQPQAYRDTVLPPSVRARVSIEAASPFGWERYVGSEGAIIGTAHFGASAPGPVVMRNLALRPSTSSRRRRPY